MHILRALGLVLLSFTALAFPVAAGSNEKAKDIFTTGNASPNAQQQLVESVDIQGNRRLRDEDLLYYIKTRPGDAYDAAQLERDLKELLSLNFFDKTATRVLTEPGVRGGVNVIFEVRELPIIRDLQFEGASTVSESDILKAFREQRVGISKEATYDPVKAKNASRILRELYASKGYPNAKVEVREEEVSATSVAITFDIDQANRSRIVDIEFEGNEKFSDGELRGALQLVKETGLITRFQGTDILDLRKLQYDLQKNVRDYMFSKGYFQARIGEPLVEGMGYKRTGIPIIGQLPLPLISSKDDTLKITVPVTEGKVFRVGELKVEGNSIFSEQQILGIVGLKKGEVADGKRLRDAVYEDLKKVYGAQGFVLYNAEFNPSFKDNPANANEGIVDIKITIDEGKQLRLRRLEFVGNTFTRDTILRPEFDIYNQIALERSVLQLSQKGYFDPIDKDKDVETCPDQGEVYSIVKVNKRGCQQILFNGGISGIGGSFFGLEYSTNNLAGRGEVLSFAVGTGNRQNNFSFTYQEPYFRDRPISVGFSLFASRYKFFGEGTFLTQNSDLLNNLITDPNASYTTDESNLFTQTTYGATVFATTQLSEILFKKSRFSQFSRIGLTYQLSATSITDPEVNQSGDAATAIPVIFRQPSILTSRITGSYVYDTRQPAANGIDNLRGTQITASIAFAGLGGDVRTYQPNVSYTQFIPVRRRKSPNAEVFAFRIQAGTIGSYATTDKIRNANSFSFIGGIPVYERYFLGSEFDIRGYDVRSLGPIIPIDSLVTTRNIYVAQNFFGDLVFITDPRIGDSGNNVALDVQQYEKIIMRFGSANYRSFSKNTQFLGNFEYRMPIFGPVTLAAFADIGSVFNLHKTDTQLIENNFLDNWFPDVSKTAILEFRDLLNRENNFEIFALFNSQIHKTPKWGLTEGNLVIGRNFLVGNNNRELAFSTRFVFGNSESEDWAEIQNSTSNTAFQSFLREYPNSKYYLLARKKLEQIEWLNNFSQSTTALSVYPNIDAQSEVEPENEFAVNISLLQSKQSDKAKITTTSKTTEQTSDGKLKMDLSSDNKKDLEIEVVLTAPGFSFRNSKNFEIITLPLNSDSTVATFYLKAKSLKSGETEFPTKIFAVFRHKGSFLAKVEQEITIKKTHEKELSNGISIPLILEPSIIKSFGNRAPNNAEAQNPKNLITSIPPGKADLSILVEENKYPGQVEDSEMQITSSFNNKTFIINFSSKKIPADWILENYRIFSAMSGRGSEIDAQPVLMKERLRGFGRQLYDRLPAEFKTAFWEFENIPGFQIKTIAITTNNPLMPWELVCPMLDKHSLPNDFLGLEYSIGRLHNKNGSTVINNQPQLISVSGITVIAPKYEGKDELKFVTDEVKNLKSLNLFANSGGFLEQDGKIEGLQTLFADIPARIIHFAGHGVVRRTDKQLDFFAIKLENGQILDSNIFEGMFTRHNDNRPLFFFNACEVGQSEQIAGFIDGWSAKILEVGASGYIGALWSIGDKGASEFSTSFYRELEMELRENGRVSVSDVLRRVRYSFLKNNDPSFMSYVFYGDPNLYLIERIEK